MSSPRVLVVEDNPVTRKMMRFALETEKYDVVEAGDGRTALALTAEKPPDLVVQDYVLPDMDGVRLIESLRKRPGGEEIPVLMVTGMVSHLDELRSHVSGPTTILPKPLEPSRLLEVVRSYLAAPRPTVGRGRKVLVIDDEVVGRKLAAMRLKEAGFDVDTAGSGEEGLQRLKEQRPDIVLSDVLMPGIDGYQLCQDVRQDPELEGVHVVLLSSAFLEPGDHELAREVGATALLPRTPDLHEAISSLTDILSRKDPPPPTAGGKATAALHAERVQSQLEKQVARNESLLRQGAIQAAALSVIRGLALALASPHDVPNILGDVLVHCLDAAGLSTGLLYVSQPGGGFRLQAQSGIPSSGRDAAADAFGRPDVLQKVLEAGEPVAYQTTLPSLDAPHREFLGAFGKDSALFVPFLVGSEPVGVLVLAADSQDLSDPVWEGFARTLGVQFGQTIALGRFLAQGAASETKYRTLMQQANDAILILDSHRKVVEANHEAERLLGRPREEIVGHPYEDFMVPLGSRDLLRPGDEPAAPAKLRMVQRRIVRGSGEEVPVEVSGSIVWGAEGGPTVLAILRDITERVRAEEALRQSAEQYRSLFEGNPHPMWVYDPVSLAFLAVNQAAVRQYGYSVEEFLGRTIADIRPEEELPNLMASLGKGLASDGVWRHKRKDGTFLEADISASPIVFRGRQARLVLATDVTEKQRLEAQLLHSQKMEAVGRLAGGVAHDFNNLLGVITGYSELLRGNLEEGHPGIRRLEQIEKAAYRAAALTKQLLAFSRKEVIQPRIVDMNAIVQDLEKMLERLIGEDVELAISLGDEVGKIRADEGQVEQVIANLVVNARDAMPRGGRLILETRNTYFDEIYARSHAEVAPGAYVMLAVSDTGHGMDAQTLSRIFEPFFTTKEAGKGTGLGLATVFGIVKQSRGHITVYSELGHGTTFKVYFPTVEDEWSAKPEEGVPLPLEKATETVLLVEDADPLREMIKEVLEDAGYSVVEHADPESALADLPGRGGEIHLILTDIVMPKMSGPELAARVQAQRPGIRTLFMSGYSNEAVTRNGVLEEGTQFLQKPFTSDALLRKVRATLEAPPAEPQKG
jgi:PAS domain S-box-containing protein